MQLTISEEAWSDIIEAVTYIAEDKPNVADDIFDKFEYTYELLSTMPEMGMPIDDLLDMSELGEEIKEIAHATPLLKGILRFPIKRFPKLMIFYKYELETLHILRVIHTKRDLPAIFSTMEITD